MYRIIDKRGSGKTSRLLLLAKETGAIVVCASPHAMKEKAHAYGLTGIQFCSYLDYIEGNKFRGLEETPKFLIDELEIFLKYFSNGKRPVIGYTLSDED